MSEQVLAAEPVDWVDIQSTLFIKLPHKAHWIICELLERYSNEDPYVGVDLEGFSAKLEVKRETVSKWVRYLVTHEYLILSGYFADGRRRYEINFSTLAKMGREYQEKAKKDLAKYQELTVELDKQYAIRQQKKKLREQEKEQRRKLREEKKILRMKQ